LRIGKRLSSGDSGAEGQAGKILSRSLGGGRAGKSLPGGRRGTEEQAGKYLQVGEVLRGRMERAYLQTAEMLRASRKELT
jgi:hypothetical protein